MRATDFKGIAIVSLAEAQKVGEVEDIALDPAANQVVSFRVKHGVFGGAQTLLATDVRSVGTDAIMIAGREVLRSQTPAHPTPTADAGSLGNVKVVTESGTVVGDLGDVEIDPGALTITAYFMSETFWEHIHQGARSFPAAAGLRFGGKLLIIPDSLNPLAEPAPATAPEAPSPAAPPAGAEATPADAPPPEPVIPAPEPAPTPEPALGRSRDAVPADGGVAGPDPTIAPDGSTG